MSRNSTKKNIVYKSLDFLGFPDYRVGDDGSVWTRKVRYGRGSGHLRGWGVGKWSLKKTSTANKKRGIEYRNTILSQGKIRKTFLVHTLVLEAFVGPCPDGMECCHNDGNPANNRLDNLRWDTRKNNQADRKLHGTYLQGNDCPWTIITDEDALKIRRMWLDGKHSQRDLAKIYGVHLSSIKIYVLKGTEDTYGRKILRRIRKS